MSISIRNLVYKYPGEKFDTIKCLNLEVKDGSILVLLGNNGCGKTTLIKNITGIINPQKGEIIVDNENIIELSIKRKSKLISYVSQKINRLEDIIILDYLTFGFTSELRFYEKPSLEQINKAKEYAKRFNISHLLHKKINEISGGERQIVSICCALLQDTKIIVLDEPTSALDLYNQNMVLSILKSIALEEKKTMILSTHNPNHALYLESMVAVMKGGIIIEYGESSSIITVEKLKEIYGDTLCYSKDLAYKELSFKNE